MLLATRHKQTHPGLTPASKAGTRLTYSRGMEGWVDLDDLITPPTGSRIRDRLIESPTPWPLEARQIKEMQSEEVWWPLIVFSSSTCWAYHCRWSTSQSSVDEHQALASSSSSFPHIPQHFELRRPISSCSLQAANTQADLPHEEKLFQSMLSPHKITSKSPRLIETVR